MITSGVKKLNSFCNFWLSNLSVMQGKINCLLKLTLRSIAMNNQKKTLQVLLAAGVALTAISGVVNAEVNPFASYEITTGYQLADAGFKAEGCCGEGKCGANAADKLNVADEPSGPDVGFNEQVKNQ